MPLRRAIQTYASALFVPSKKPIAIKKPPLIPSMTLFIKEVARLLSSTNCRQSIASKDNGLHANHGRTQKEKLRQQIVGPVKKLREQSGPVEQSFRITQLGRNSLQQWVQRTDTGCQFSLG
jgi:hypothetical protein